MREVNKKVQSLNILLGAKSLKVRTSGVDSRRLGPQVSTAEDYDLRCRLLGLGPQVSIAAWG
jgi:hypothetical protein